METFNFLAAVLAASVIACSAGAAPTEATADGARSPVRKGTLDFAPFLNDLAKRGILAQNAYLTAVELGNEVTDGSGQVVLRRFEISRSK